MRNIPYYISTALLLVACARDRILIPSPSPESRLSSRFIADARSEIPAMTIRLDLGEIRAQSEDEYTVLQAKGLTLSESPSQVAPADRSILLVFPETVSPRLKVNAIAGTPVEGVRLARRAEPCRCGEEVPAGPELQPFVSSAKSESPARIEPVATIGGIRLFRLRFSPLQYSASEKTLRSYRSIDATISADWQFPPESVELTPSWYRLLKTVTANGDTLTSSIAQPTRIENLYVIAADALIPALKPWLEWKAQLGLRPLVFAASQIGQDPRAIRNFLAEQYRNQATAPTFVLLVGDANSLPPFYEKTSTDVRRLAASDYPFSLMNEDSIPDIFYGRLLAQRADEVSAQVEKWIRYEKSQNQNPEWLGSATLLASREGLHPSDEDYARILQGLLKKFAYHSLDLFFEREKTSTTDHILRALRDGRSWMTYFGHGNGVEWSSTTGKFGVQNLKNLPPHAQNPIVIDVSCRNGAFSLYSRCLGKAWIERSDAGAVAYFGSSVDVSWHEPAVMALGMTENHFEKNNRVLGPAAVAGQLKMIERYGASRRALDTMKSYVMLGDPSLQTRAGVSTPYQLHSKVSCDAASCDLSFDLSSLVGAPQPGIQVAVAYEDGTAPVAVGITESDGRVKLSVPHGVHAPTWLVTSSAPGHETYRYSLAWAEDPASVSAPSLPPLEFPNELPADVLSPR